MRNKLCLFAFLGAFCFSGSIYATEPQNIWFAKQELVKYHDSGEYTQDVQKVVADAKQYLIEKLKEKDAVNKKYAIVLDIDDTSLSTYGFETKFNFGGRIDDIENAQRLANYPAIPAVLDLYNFAKENKVGVFFVTGRSDKFKNVTVRNLLQAGYKNWSALYLKSSCKNAPKMTVIEYKSKCREAITKQGYEIVINMGDQQTDLEGGFADKNYKLPNPFYLVP